MKSYIDIALNFKGKNCPARLYGDKIVSDLCGLELNKKNVVSYKINFFKRKITLFFDRGESRESLIAGYHDTIVRWFDPLYKTRFFIVGIFMILPVLATFAIAGIKNVTSSFWPLLLLSLVVSFSSGLLALIFFRLAQRKNRHKGDNFYLRIFLLLLAVCLPVMYWYPFSVYIFAGGIGLFGLFSLAHYVFASAFAIYKYYLSLAWVLLVIFLYFWIIGAIKLVLDFNLYNSASGVIGVSSDQTVYSYGNLTWEKPIDWKISRFHFFQTLLKRRQLLWQFSPLPVQESISTPDFKDFGWIAVSGQTPAQTLVQINQYLEAQKNLLLADLLEKSVPVQETSKAGPITFQSLTYYDMIERKVSSINILLIGVIDDSKTGSINTMIFTFKVPSGSSVNYYLDLIKGGINPQRSGLH